MFRFEAKKGYFLYPEANETENEPLWLNRGTTFEKNVVPRDGIFVKKHGLRIPKAVDYKSFVKQIEDSENSFKKEFGVSAGG